MVSSPLILRIIHSIIHNYPLSTTYNYSTPLCPIWSIFIEFSNDYPNKILNGFNKPLFILSNDKKYEFANVIHIPPIPTCKIYIQLSLSNKGLCWL